MEKAPPDLELITRYFSDLTSRQLEQLTELGPLYADWNSKINVISRKDIDALYEKHVLHSLSIAAITAFPAGSAVIDIGTGGGFPGIPLAIFFPGTTFHLVDSIAKKLKVVEEVAASIGLTNVTTEHIRAEAIKELKFDYVVSRAVASLKELWHWSKPLLRRNRALGTEDVQGRPSLPTGLICLKGGDLGKEIAESGTVPEVTELYAIFPEPFFQEKRLLFVPCRGKK